MNVPILGSSHYTEPYNIGPSVSGWFHMARCFLGLAILQQLSDFHSFLRLHKGMCLPQLVYPLIMATWVDSIFWLLWRMLSWTLVSVWVPVFHTLGYIPRSQSAGLYGGSLCNSLKYWWMGFHRSCTILCSHQFLHIFTAFYFPFFKLQIISSISPWFSR